MVIVFTLIVKSKGSKFVTPGREMIVKYQGSTE